MTKAMIVSVSDTQIKATNLKSKDCSACTANCSKACKTFCVTNPQMLPITVGSIVNLEVSKKRQILEGVSTLLVPFICAIIGYIVAGKLFPLQKDACQAVGVLASLVVSSLAVSFITKKLSLAGNIEVKNIIS